MRTVASVAGIRDAEERFFAEHPGVDLMAVAAGRVAAEARGMLPEDGQGSVLVAVGPGNNGGDGLFAAADLAGIGVRVSVWLTGEQAHEAGLAAARAAGCVEVDGERALALLVDVDLVIDAVLGIGGRGGLPKDVSILAHAVRDLGVAVLAVDLPSGLSGDSHVAHDSFLATRTLTFGAAKRCHVAQPAASRCGEVVVADIGIEVADEGVHQLEPADVAIGWPWPSATDDKYSRGVLGVDTGSDAYPGAAVLSTLGAVYSGVGMVRFLGPDRAADKVLDRMPSVTFGSGRVNANLVGCGWSDADANRDRLAARVADDVPMVVDADAISLLPTDLPDGSLLTPHAGELAKLLDVERAEVEGDPIGSATQAAQRFGATVLLKGATNYCLAPSGEVLIAVAGPAWTAQAGSGDSLAGVCGTLLAAGVDPLRAGAFAASVQALTAERVAGPYPPDWISGSLPSTLGELRDLAGTAGLD